MREQKLSFAISKIGNPGNFPCWLTFMILERQYHLPRSNELHKCLTVVLYWTHHFHYRPEFLSDTTDHFP